MTRRSIVAVISIFVHTVVVFAAMTADMWRPITEWPTPRSAMAYVADVPRPVRLVDIELPKPPRTQPTATAPAPGSPATTTQPIELAPTIAPSGISDETRREGTITRARLADVESNGGGVGPIGPPIAPPPAPPATQPPVRLSSGIRAPQRVVNVTPVYPAAARLTHVEGFVIIEATIDEKGNVARAQVLRSIPLLDEAALTAVRQWKFTPTLLNGVAVPIVMTVTVNFKLD
jgi:protein TonB